MNIFLTGGTGFVGSAVLRALLASGHTVTALARSRRASTTLAAAGATVVAGDITDTAWLTEQLAASDGAIHTASPGDETSVAVDTSIAQAAASAFAGTDKPYVHTGGAWVYGSGADITEDLPFNPPALTAWRASVESIVLDADIRATVIEPGIVYDGRHGIPGMLADSPRDESGALHLIGGGEQHWTTIHVDDLASLYLRVVESDAGHGYVIGASGQNPTVRDLGEAIAGDAGVVPESDDDTQARFGEAFGEALLLDQQATGAKARSLGWTPTRPSLVEQLRG